LRCRSGESPAAAREALNGSGFKSHIDKIVGVKRGLLRQRLERKEKEIRNSSGEYSEKERKETGREGVNPL